MISRLFFIAPQTFFKPFSQFAILKISSIFANKNFKKSIKFTNSPIRYAPYQRLPDKAVLLLYAYQALMRLLSAKKYLSLPKLLHICLKKDKPTLPSSLGAFFATMKSLMKCWYLYSVRHIPTQARMWLKYPVTVRCIFSRRCSNCCWLPVAEWLMQANLRNAPFLMENLTCRKPKP